MSKCKSCGKSEGVYEHYDGGFICSKCAASFFNCPGCGKLFYTDDYDYGDAGTGYCKECSLLN